MNQIINYKWRSLAFILTTTLFIFSGFLLSSAFGRQRKSAPSLRTATNLASPGFAFAPPQQLVKTPVSPIFFQQDAEPEIKVDVFGNIYVTAINGVPGGTDLWKSTDKGASFTYLGQPDGAQDHCSAPTPQCVAAGGGDDSIDVSPGGYLYVSSLYIGNVTVSTSTDGGTGGLAPGQAWQVNPAAAAVVADDRQWVAAYGPQTLNMTYRQAPGTGDLFFVKSTDAGKTFGAPVLVRTGDSTEGNLVVDPYNGNLYTTTIPSTNLNQIHLLKSVDGGATWTESTAYSGAAATDPAHKFTILAIDRGGNLHLVFSSTDTLGHCHVYLTSSTNQGASWLLPVQVDSGTGNTTTATMPWVVAGSPGVVDITWLGSSATSLNVAPFDWRLFFAQTTNALTASPTFNQAQVTTNPIHDKIICFNGSACATGTRELLEYYTMALDPDGNANIAFPDSIDADSCPTATCITNTWFTKQTAGASAYTPPTPPAAATFATNIPVGSPGAEPSISVDLYNCIYVTAPGNPWVWKSINNGASFLSPINPVADEPTLTGGDEDILTLPQASGARPDQIYFADLGITTVHVRKSTDGSASYFKPGPSGAAADTGVSSDRQWLAGDRGFPAATDQIVYEWDHEFSSEVMRMSALVNDTVWQSASGMTTPELATTVPNTNPGPVFVDKTRDPVWAHRVFGLFNASVPTTNATNPPFGKLLNIWEADGPPPAAAGAPPGPFVNHPVFKGVYDSPAGPVPPPPPVAAKTYGANNANIFPAGDIDSAGNIYVAWSMNNARTNEFSIWFAASHDHGQTFYGPFPVSSGPMTADETAVLPWVAAGDNGQVDIVWYKTTAVGDSNTLTGNPPWNLFFAQSQNANSREPVFTVVQAGDHVMHNGQISTGGLIGSSDRSLLDFFEIAVGPDGLANIIYADNGGTATHAEFARQNGGPLARTSPTSPTCVVQTITPVKAVSRKTHGPGPGGTSTTFDINLPFTGPVGIECRNGTPSGKDYQVVITFAVPVTVGGVSVSSSDGMATATETTSNQIVTVDLHNVANAQTLIITLSNVSDGTHTGNVGVPMGVLIGDTNADRFVNSADISQTKSQSGNTLSESNFREDVNVDGFLNSADISLVKSKSGTGF
jgi:hypothetical protein